MRAKTALFSLCALLTACATQPQATVEMQPGLWEFHLLKMEVAGNDMLESTRRWTRSDQEQQAKLPPEQRKQIRDPLVEPICISAAMTKVEDWMMALVGMGWAGPGGCTPPKVSHSVERTTSETTCKPEDGGKVRSMGSSIYSDKIVSGIAFKVEMLKIDETSVGMAIKMEETIEREEEGTSQRAVVQESRMRFLSSDCGGLKPSYVLFGSP